MCIDKIKKAVIREDLLSITGNYKEAIILNQFIYWSERVSDADKFIKIENEIARKNGEPERELLYGWIYKTAEQLADEIMLGLSSSQIRKYIAKLVDYGYIYRRTNPKYKWDRTFQYRVNLVNVAKALKSNGYSISDYKIDIPEDGAESSTHQCAINESQSQHQSPADDAAIPETTIYINNRDYNTKNTDKASTVVEENYKAFFSEKEKKILELPSLPYEYSQEEFDKFIYVKIYNIILQIPGVNSEDLEKAGAITEIISYFHKKYLERTGERHPIMKDSVYESIVRKMLNPIDAIIELDAFMDVDSYKRMIDRFFSTQYGKKSGNITDYRIGYFFGNKVLERLCYRECQ